MAQQLAARDAGGTDAFLLNPPEEEFPRNQLPAPLVGGPQVSYIPERVRAGHADRRLPGEPEAGDAIRIGPARECVRSIC